MSAFDQQEKTFTVEDNVYIGKQEPLECSYDSVGELFLEKLKETPGKVILVDHSTKKEYTCDEIRRSSVKCALWLRKQGIGEGDVVCIYSQNKPEVFPPYIAAYLVGATLASWTTIKSKSYAQHFVTLLRPKVVFADPETAVMIDEIAKEENVGTQVIVIGQLSGYQSLNDVWSDASFTDTDVEAFKCKPIVGKDDAGQILFSSGTTGRSKGIPISHRNLQLLKEAWVNVLEGGSVGLFNSSLSWISSLFYIHRCIVCDTKLVIPVDLTEENVCKAVQTYKVQSLMMGPSALKRLARSDAAKKYDLSSMKNLLVGGAVLKPLEQETIMESLPGVKISQGYGMTEASGVITIQSDKCKKPGSSGFVARNVMMKIVDVNSGKTLGANQQGEICFKSKLMMKGYYKNPEETKKTIDKDGWLHTGDLAYVDEDGELFVLDRLKEMIKYRGYQMSPSEIESVLHSHPDVLEACVVALPDPVDDELPMAFIATRKGIQIEEQDLLDLVTNNLEDFQRLRGGIKFLDEFPKTASGKVDRSSLRQHAKTLATSN